MRLSSVSALAIAVAIPLALSACQSSDTTPTTEAPVAEATVERALGAAALDTERLLAADSEPASWLTTGQNYWEERYSRLDEVNTSNVANLGLAWSADIDTERGQESTPVVIDGVMYLTTAWSMVKAYDIATGEELWAYDPEIDRAKGADACCDVVNRGVAAWNGKIYVGLLDGRLVALDGKTGSVVWETQTTDTSLPYTITGVPRIVKGKVVIGNGGAEYRVRGYATAYDAETGEQVWRWYSIPGNPADGFEQPELEEVVDTWNGEWWELGGGGTIWDGMAYDPELDLLYLGVGNGTPWNQKYRSPGGGDNLYLSSIVAVKPDTGEYVWHYQTTPGETRDYTATQPIMVTELDYPEGKRKVVMQAPRTASSTSSTQRPANSSAEKFAPLTWATHVDMETGRPVEVPEARYEVTGVPAIVAPAALGMHNWHPMAFSKDTGYVYLPVTVSSSTYASPEEFTPNMDGWNTGIGFRASDGVEPVVATGVNPERDSYLLAWDPVAAKEVWRVTNETYGPSGTLATAGGLVFSGNHSGEFVAYDAKTGEKLWSADTQARIVAAPATFEANGAQHVALLAGARGLPPEQERTNPISANNSRVLVYRLGATGTLPATLEEASAGASGSDGVRINPPLLEANNETVAEGEQLYGANCAICHGPASVPAAGAVAPDLRYSGLLVYDRQWDEAVLEGNRAQRGMPGFSATLSDEQSEAIRHYVIKRANDEKAAQEAAAN